VDISQQREALAERVRLARQERGWSKEHAARKADISSITWKRIEDGLAVQDVKLAAALRVLEINQRSVGAVVDAPSYVAGPGDVPSGPTVSDDEVVAEIRAMRERLEELERRLGGRP
jgi:ribosome-binding protein aMBF1 (putative translation factor)